MKYNMADSKQTVHKYHSWFVSILTNNIEDINRTRDKYEKLRKLTELWYIYKEYLPILYINNNSYNKLTVAIYNSIQRMNNDIYDELLVLKGNIDKNVYEKKRIIYILLEEMRNTEDIIIPLLPKAFTSTHLVRSVTEDTMKIRKSAKHTFFVYDYE
jgi:hypothetical protein